MAVGPRPGLVGAWLPRGDGLVRVEIPSVGEDAGTGRGDGPAEAPGGPTPHLRAHGGRWVRRLRFPDGGVGEERGLAFEEAPLLLVERIREGAADTASRFALLAGGVDPDLARRLLAQVPARALVRERRGTPFPEEAFSLRAGPGAGDGPPAGASIPTLEPALRILDEALLWPDGEPPPGRGSEPHLSLPVLAGCPATPDPSLLRGSALVEYGLAALVTGRWSVARALLAPRGRAPEDDPLPLLLLAARWSLWTGLPLPAEGGGDSPEEELDRLVGVALDRDREEADGAPPPLGAAFPPLSRVLEELAEAMEGTGGGERAAGLRERVRELRRGRGAGLRLPVLGGAGEGRSPPSRPLGAVLPPPQAFAPLDAPAILPRATLHAARLVRSWVEGTLGVRPDASTGRISVRLDLRGTPLPLSVGNLRVGGARIHVDCRREGAVHTFGFDQAAGRVPVNLILQARLPVPGIREVRIGEAPAEVEILEEEGGTLFRCQFPLDPERRVSVVGEG